MRTSSGAILKTFFLTLIKMIFLSALIILSINASSHSRGRMPALEIDTGKCPRQ
jgi:hypothetical protein